MPATVLHNRVKATEKTGVMPDFTEFLGWWEARESGRQTSDK